MVERRSVGQNVGLIDDMYQQYLDDPSSVSESWQDFFSDYGREPDKPAARGNGDRPAEQPASEADRATPTGPDDEAVARSDEPPEPPGEPIRGVAARIVENMESSLAVPTATSYREIPAKLLEVNRKIVNGYLARKGRGKISFTHLIGYAVVRAIADHVPAMNATFVDDPSGPRIVRHPHVGLGIAVDVEKRDGSRSLVVPSIKDADTLDFAEFVDRYEELIRKVRANKLEADDLAGTTVSLTNPGMIGTERSVPRLMPGQGVIVGVGSIDYPAGLAAADPHTLAEIGVSKITTVSSTYDHRIIQGAESGLFLRHVHDLLIGEHDFYVEALRSLGVPYEAVKWRRDVMPADHERGMAEKQVQVNAIVNMHRVRGHLIADLDPLGLKEPLLHPELDPATYGLTIWDLDREFLPTGLTGIDQDRPSPRLPLGDILHIMRDAYCRTVGIEYMHIQEPAEKRWIQDHVEGADTTLELDEKLHLLDRLNAAEALERFLATKYVGQKRFGLEGGESAIPILDTILSDAADVGMRSAVLGMAHRGRLNVLVNLIGKSHEQLFREFEDTPDEKSIQGSGDVKYHLGMSGKFVGRNGAEIEVELAANPSHLEAVNPVVEGMVRARMDQIEPPGDYPVLPLLLHGDAAFAGQGVVAETLNLSQIRGYRTGGTIHLVINNQLGFTTTPEAARSSQYPTDVAKTVQAPIFHVNGDDPEACVRVAHLAMAYRQRFHKDVVIDMWCYRRHGHNEGDDPSYTQPLMYDRIGEKRSVRKQYVEKLVQRGDLTLEEAEDAMDDFRNKLQTALDATRDATPPGEIAPRPAPRPVGVLPPAHTAVRLERLQEVYRALSTTPEGFSVHPKLAQQLERRDAMFERGEVDWALAEALAFGSLLAEGTSIRLAGQDSRRGTFSQRHSTLVDHRTGDEHQPLEALCGPRSRVWFYDSLLSEYAALGFEYGYSVVNKDALVIWEAQFGDFMNGAQIIIDQFVVAAEDKWGQTSGLVMLLPHGYEGQGPEHSSARIERFLLLAAEDNIQAVNPSTAAQYFHVLRRQVRRAVRKPLILFTPKSLLRAKAAHSTVDELTSGTFQEVLADPGVADAGAVERVIFCTGKVAHDAIRHRDETEAPVAVVRVEQLYPWPFAAVADALARYANAREIIWLQEEPENMGPWNFVKGRFYEAHGDDYRIKRVSRFESGSPATGSAGIHAFEQRKLLEKAFAPLA